MPHGPNVPGRREVWTVQTVFPSTPPAPSGGFALGSPDSLHPSYSLTVQSVPVIRLLGRVSRSSSSWSLVRLKLSRQPHTKEHWCLKDTPLFLRLNFTAYLTRAVTITQDGCCWSSWYSLQYNTVHTPILRQPRRVVSNSVSPSIGQIGKTLHCHLCWLTSGLNAGLILSVNYHNGHNKARQRTLSYYVGVESITRLYPEVHSFCTPYIIPCSKILLVVDLWYLAVKSHRQPGSIWGTLQIH
jgi:hypothetical protein